MEPAPFGEAAQALLERLRDAALTADELVRAAAIEPAQGSAGIGGSFWPREAHSPPFDVDGSES